MPWRPPRATLFPYTTLFRSVMEIVRGHFRPEFINRVDDIVVFHPLGREQLHYIAGLQVRALRERLRARDMDLELTERALDHLRSEEHTSELQSHSDLVCRLL